MPQHFPACHVIPPTSALAPLRVVSLNRMSLDCVASPRRQSGMVTLPAFECYPCGLNNGATSRALVHSAVIAIFFKQLQIYILYLFCVNIRLILKSFYNTALSDKQLSLYVI